MKKILTVSLFAIMAVSAANAEIASTKYVDDAKSSAVSTAAADAASKANAAQEAAEAKVTALEGSLAKVAKSGAYADLTGTPTVDSTFSATSDNAATSKAIAGYVNTVKTELSNGNTAAVEGLQDQIDALDTTYVSETEIANYTNTTGMNSAIATAKSEAISTAAADATSKANAAQEAAEAKVTALANGAVKTNTTNISTITTNLGALNGVTIPAACTTGRCALVMESGAAKWETINY